MSNFYKLEKVNLYFENELERITFDEENLKDKKDVFLRDIEMKKLREGDFKAIDKRFNIYSEFTNYFISCYVSLEFKSIKDNYIFKKDFSTSFPIIFLDDYLNDKDSYETKICTNFLFNNEIIQGKNQVFLLDSITEFLESNKESLKKGIEVLSEIESDCNFSKEDYQIINIDDEYFIFKNEDKTFIVDSREFLTMEKHSSLLFINGFSFYLNEENTDDRFKSELSNLFYKIKEFRLKKMLKIK